MTAPWLAFAKAAGEALKWDGRDRVMTRYDLGRALLAGVAAAEAALAERDALLVRAEATIERYRGVMESICATGLALGRSDVDNVVRESWETLKAIREGKR